MELMVLGLLAPLVTTVTYFFFSEEPILYRRALTSSHGAFLLLSIGYAALASNWSTLQTWERFIGPFYLLLAAFAISTGYSLVRFKGTKLVHLLQLYQIPLALPYWVLGTMAITHDSI
jgi:hypothetical protein